MPLIDPESRPVTFLQFLCEQLLGPPLRQGGSPGESYWCCPFCDKDKFHTLPAKLGTKDYFKCFVCNNWGDEYNLLRFLRDNVGHPPDHRQQRRPPGTAPSAATGLRAAIHQRQRKEDSKGYAGSGGSSCKSRCYGCLDGPHRLPARL